VTQPASRETAARRYRGVLLDVDGTLVDSNDAHAHAWQEAFAAHGREVAYATIRGLVGMGGDHLIETITGLPPSDLGHREIAEFRGQRFRSHWLHQVRPFAGARELVLRLRGEAYLYAIASSARNQELEPLLEIAGIGDLCDVRVTSSDTEHSKPDPDIIEASLSRLGLERARAVLIGDTPYDVEASHRAGIDAIGVTSGGFSPAELRGAIAVFAGAAELLARWHASPLA
jgi:HAD superfamily hydrolase (TIGR01509 family)